jgi:dienelactone hydrolase
MRSESGRTAVLRGRRVLPVAADGLRTRLTELLSFAVPPVPELLIRAERERDGYVEQMVSYTGDEGEVPALLLVPKHPCGAGVVALHQHNSQWHLGKSEVAGLAGEPLQAFGPALARAGIVVLAPDAVGFEDRRHTGPGIDEREDDWLQYFNEMAYRLVSGRLLVTTVLGDAARGLSVLITDERVDSSRVGVIGHSYGGNVTIMLVALDERVRFACASGSACSYRQRMLDRTGIEFAHVIPGILELTDIGQLVELIAPRPLLLLSATEDRYSADTPEIVRAAARAYREAGAPQALQHYRAQGGHALTEERFDAIVDWVTAQMSENGNIAGQS